MLKYDLIAACNIYQEFYNLNSKGHDKAKNCYFLSCFPACIITITGKIAEILTKRQKLSLVLDYQSELKQHMKVKRFGVSLDEQLLTELDHFVDMRKFPNRSQAIRYLISNYLVEKKTDANKIVAGSIVLVFDHHKRNLQTKSTAIQHDFQDVILSMMHVHIDHHNCLETITVMGKAHRLKELSDKLIAIKGVKHGKLVTTTTD